MAISYTRLLINILLVVIACLVVANADGGGPKTHILDINPKLGCVSDVCNKHCAAFNKGPADPSCDFKLFYIKLNFSNQDKSITPPGVPATRLGMFLLYKRGTVAPIY